jgi:hypothetical protein
LVHVVDDALDGRGGLARAGAQARVLREEASEDRLRIRLPSMHDRIVEGELPRGIEAHIRPNLRRV